MIATITFRYDAFARAFFTALAATAFTFLATVVVGGNAPILVTATVACGVAGAILALGQWQGVPARRLHMAQAERPRRYGSITIR
jgi:putative Ca2+/H+ antiporter (TMEM165/GDT1 family)